MYTWTICAVHAIGNIIYTCTICAVHATEGFRWRTIKNYNKSSFKNNFLLIIIKDFVVLYKKMFLE